MVIGPVCIFGRQPQYNIIRTLGVSAEWPTSQGSDGHSPEIEYTAVSIQIEQTMQLQTVRLPVLKLSTAPYHNGLAVRTVNSKQFTDYR